MLGDLGNNPGSFEPTGTEDVETDNYPTSVAKQLNPKQRIRVSGWLPGIEIPVIRDATGRMVKGDTSKAVFELSAEVRYFDCRFATYADAEAVGGIRIARSGRAIADIRKLLE